MNNYFIILALILFVYMNLWFFLSLSLKRNDIADVAWGLGFVLMSWLSFMFSPDKSAVGILVSVLVSIWGLRLSWHIYNRNKTKSEDYRYAKWRNDWGKLFYLRSYMQIYLLQGVLLYIIVMPILMINRSESNGFSWVLVAGIAVWITGFLFESVGDWQLSKFIKDPQNKGRLMTKGLWRFSRHPNYFGEVVQWWGVWIIATGFPYGYFSVIGPLTITFLILKVSGVPMLEKKLEQHPDFAEYKRSVSVFLPLPPKS